MTPTRVQSVADQIHPAHAQPLGYEVEERIYSGQLGTVYRGRRVHDGCRVLLKTPDSARPSARDVADFAHEYAVLTRLAGTAVVGAISLEEVERRPWLILDDHGGQPLDKVASRYRLPARTLAIGAKIATALAEIHRRGIVHRDLKPQQVIVLDDGSLRLTGFRTASLLRVDASVTSMQGSLAYMAPEQTGRMNRPVDKRADLYSLGVILYVLLTGRLPFEATEPLEWVHAHIAKAPPPPETIDERVPSSVSALVLKLLSKHAEDRYHGADAVARDLQRCIDALERGETVPFELAVDDAPDDFRVSHRLYGRQTETAQLLAGFERARTGSSCVVSLVGGYSGVGKTSVVGSLYQPIVRERGRFVGGKFDQYKRDIPYATIVQAFRDLVRDILVAGEASLNDWRARLREAVGVNGRIIADVVPELELVIGPQATLPDLDPQEAQNRFEAVLLSFIRVFARRDHPLVMFLDDLQWADAATLGVLKLLARPGEVPALQLVLAYRDNEVGAAHPFHRCVEGMRADGAAVDVVPVRDLRPDDVTRFVADTVSRAPLDRDVRELSDLVQAKAGGNPFFITELFHALDGRGLFTYDRELRGWTWESAALRAIDVTDNVVDLLVQRFRNLPELTQASLKLASCFGSHFRLGTLASTLALPNETVANALFDALDQGLIVSVVDEIGEARTFRFHHDRIQQAAYSQLSDFARAEAHLRIGRLLRDALKPGRDEALFDVVKHLDQAADLIDGPGERQRVVELNLMASRRAKAAIAWEPARLYLESAVRFFAPDAWTADAATTFEVVRELAQCEFLTGRFASAEARFDELRRRASSAAQRAEVATLQVRLYIITSRYDLALALGIRELERLGEPLPNEDADVAGAVADERRRLTAWLGGREIQSIVDLPLLANDEKRAAINLLASLPPAIYSRRPAIFPILAMKIVNLSFEYGNCEASCFGYSMYAMLLAAGEGDADRGFAFSEVSIALNDRLRDPKLLGTVLHVHANHLVFWKRPYEEAIALLERAYAACVEVGDLTIAAYVVFMGTWLSLERGQPLAHAERTIGVHEGLIQGTRHETARDAVRIQGQFLRALAGGTTGPLSLSSETFDADAARARIAAAGLDTALAMHDLLRAMLCWYHGQISDADRYLSSAASSLPAAFCLPLQTTWSLFDALTAAARWETATAVERPDLRARVVHAEAQLRRWARDCPANFAAKHAVVAAELARLDGRLLDAQRGYEQAARVARQAGMRSIEAIATGLAAQVYGANELPTAAYAWLAEQHDVMRHWGATALVERHEAANPSLRRAAELADATVLVAPSQLDVLTAVKASQTLSREFAVERLTETLLRIVLENAGAERALILLARAGRLEVAGVSAIEGSDAAARLSEYPASVVRYVERTREAVVLASVRENPMFGGDPYFQNVNARSVLCMPILIRGAIGGLLYLENTLASAAFSPERLALLEVISTQLAISLENVHLLQEREHNVAQAARDEALAWSDRRYRDALDAMSDAFCALDRNWRYLAVNQNLERLARKTRQELLGHSIWELFPDVALPDNKYFVEYHRVMEDRVAAHFVEHYAPLGVWTDVDVLPSDDGGILVFLRDVTESKQLEHEQQQLLVRETAARELAEETVRHNEMFAGMLGHDLRNPLSAIMGGAQYLARGKASADKVIATAARIGSSSDRMARMIDQLLDWTRIRTGGGLALAIARINLASLCGRVREEIEASQPARSVELDDNGDTWLEADGDRLLQVLSNLVGNAAQHGDPDSAIRLFLDGRGEREVRLSIWNAGAIPAELLTQLFEPFRGTMSKGSKGLGLGLYISEQIVKAHGGRISVLSTPTAGTTIEVALPRHRVAVADA